MPQPTLNQVHVNVPMTQISVAYMQAQENFIAQKVFPIVPVDKQSDLYFTYDQNAWFRDQAERRAPSTESAGSGYTVSTTSYTATVWALHKDVSDMIRRNTDVPLDADTDATEWLTMMMLLRQEIQWAADYMVTGIWGTDVTPTNLWSDYINGDPITDIETGKLTILQNTGFMPNTLVLSYQVFRQLKQHPDIVDRYKHTSAQSITAEMIGAVFEVPNVYVSKAVKATNVENETAAYSLINSKNALLCYAAPRPSLRMPSAGYIFAWRGVSEGLGTTLAVKKFRMDWLESDRVEAQYAWADQLISSQLGYFFNAAVA